MNNYRDSSFQFQHLTHSHYALYSEWMDDETLPPPDEPMSTFDPNALNQDINGNRNPDIATNNDGNVETMNSGGGDGGRNNVDNNTEYAGRNGEVVTTTAGVIPMLNLNNDANVHGDSLGTQYWDFFDDEENWEIFNKYNLQVESNGRIIYNHIMGQNVNAVTNDGDINDSSEDKKDLNVVSGSLFDPRVLKRIRDRVNGWNDMGENIA